jgi:UDP-glucose 4-epimerase
MGPRRAGDPARLVADASAAAALGWTPRFNDIEAIVGHALAWEKARQRRFSSL